MGTVESLPTIVRAGAVVRVEPLDESGRGHGLGLATVDLRFSDGRMERWVGPGEVSGERFSRADGHAIVAFGMTAFENNADSLAEELAEAFGEFDLRELLEAPREVVVEWNCELPGFLR